MLYRSMDHIKDTQTGGGDILHCNNATDSKNNNSTSQAQARRKSEID